MPEYHSIKSLDHAPAVAMALGNMVVAWAYADTMLISTLSRVSGMGLNMALAGYHRIPTFESRTKFITGVIEDWKPPAGFDKDEITKAIEKLAKLASTRNHWIHGDWCATEDRSETVIFNQRAPLASTARKTAVKAPDIENHIEAVLRRAADLGRLVKFHELDI